MPEDLITRRDHNEHAVIFAPKAGLLELLMEGRLRENAAWKEVTPFIDVSMIRVELIEVGFTDGAERDGLTL